MKWVVAAVVICLAAGVAVAQQQDPYSILDEWPQAWRLKAGYADLGDFDDAAAVAVEFNAPQWTLTFGWADISTVRLQSGSTKYDFDGDYWFFEATYTYRPPSNPLLYFGIGPGWYDVDGDFREVSTGAWSSPDDDCIGGHVVVGVESADRRWFGEIQWVFGTDHWSWDTDGVRAFVGYRF